MVAVMKVNTLGSWMSNYSNQMVMSINQINRIGFLNCNNS